MCGYIGRFSLLGKRALLTGASRGIGAEIATVLADARADASKAGMNNLTQVMAAEWGQFNIQANAIAPAIILTDMAKKVWSDDTKSGPVKARIPLHRFGEQVEIANLVLYLASPASDFICGQVVVIDGGYSAV
jgi:NAD(P)-dependent dehydrogenase (short-subunit alcohol dehydrogenase family)